MNDPPTPRARRSPACPVPEDTGAVLKPLPVGSQPVAVASGDNEAAFRSLYAEYAPALLRLTTALTSGDRGRAEDLVQETMLRAWTHRDNLDISHRCPQAWLTTVARHLAVDAHRARRARPRGQAGRRASVRRQLPDLRPHRRSCPARRDRHPARSPASGTDRDLLPRPVRAGNGAHPAHPARHGQITHLLRVARAAPRPRGARRGGRAAFGQTASPAAAAHGHQTHPQPPGRACGETKGT
jgi:RNA polymerase sigma factor (sigma-70 family)